MRGLGPTVRRRTCAAHSAAIFFFNDPRPTEIYTLSLHDALPISFATPESRTTASGAAWRGPLPSATCSDSDLTRSEEHTSELQSQSNLVCRLLLEKKKSHASRVSKTPRRLSALAVPSCPPLPFLS